MLNLENIQVRILSILLVIICSTVFTSDHPQIVYIVYPQYMGGLKWNQHQNQKIAKKVNREYTRSQL